MQSLEIYLSNQLSTNISCHYSLLSARSISVFLALLSVFFLNPAFKGLRKLHLRLRCTRLQYSARFGLCTTFCLWLSAADENLIIFLACINKKLSQYQRVIASRMLNSLFTPEGCLKMNRHELSTIGHSFGVDWTRSNKLISYKEVFYPSSIELRPLGYFVFSYLP